MGGICQNLKKNKKPAPPPHILNDPKLTIVFYDKELQYLTWQSCSSDTSDVLASPLQTYTESVRRTRQFLSIRSMWPG